MHVVKFLKTCLVSKILNEKKGIDTGQPPSKMLKIMTMKNFFLDNSVFIYFIYKQDYLKLKLYYDINYRYINHNIHIIYLRGITQLLTIDR